MRRLFILCTIAIALACCTGGNSGQLAPGSWDPAVRRAIGKVIANNRHKGGYAVFDFDKTTIVHDVSQALWVYQIEHLCYAAAAENAFLDGIPDTSRQINGISLARLGEILKEDFMKLEAMKADGRSLDEIHASEQYLDFRARMAVLLSQMDGIFGSEVSYLWMPGLLAGYTEEEARSLIHDAVLDQLGKEKLAVEQWSSPDGEWNSLVERGIYFPPEMKDLYKCMSGNGITPYVCSASLELIVEVLACDSELGLGLPPEQVFGLRFVPSALLVAQFDSTYVQPMGPGKVACIQTFMAPSHGGRGPVLVGGDSNGDVPMLTAFEDMQCGLIIDVGRSPSSKIGQLAAKARADGNRGRYILQSAFAKAEGAVEGGGI